MMSFTVDIPIVLDVFLRIAALLFAVTFILGFYHSMIERRRASHHAETQSSDRMLLKYSHLLEHIDLLTSNQDEQNRSISDLAQRMEKIKRTVKALNRSIEEYYDQLDVLQEDLEDRVPLKSTNRLNNIFPGRLNVYLRKPNSINTPIGRASHLPHRRPDFRVHPRYWRNWMSGRTSTLEDIPEDDYYDDFYDMGANPEEIFLVGDPLAPGPSTYAVDANNGRHDEERPTRSADPGSTHQAESDRMPHKTPSLNQQNETGNATDRPANDAVNDQDGVGEQIAHQLWEEMQRVFEENGSRSDVPLYYWHDAHGLQVSDDTAELESWNQQQHDMGDNGGPSNEYVGYDHGGTESKSERKSNRSHHINLDAREASNDELKPEGLRIEKRGGKGKGKEKMRF